jgi:short-subunit dehydrogenase
MAEKGAKNLILLNRSGLAKVSAQSTIHELTEKGIQVDILACDISNESEVRQMFLDISWGAPPVRGIVHGAMVLKVSEVYPIIKLLTS